MRRETASLLSALLLAALPCACGSPFADPASIRAAVVAGMVASTDGLSPQQVSMFQIDLRNAWAVAFDPASPPGCTPGGLWGSPDAAAIPEHPCTAYVLSRRKGGWSVVAHGLPGTFAPPADAPKDLGSPGRLAWLAQ